MVLKDTLVNTVKNTVRDLSSISSGAQLIANLLGGDTANLVGGDGVYLKGGDQ